MFDFLSSTFYRFRRRWSYGLVALMVTLGVCVGTPKPSQALSLIDLIIRGVQIIQLDNMSDRQEIELGRRINDQMVGREFRLYRDSDLNAYVNSIGQRLAQASDRPNIPYTFQIVQDNRINAFATAGGYVYATTGLIKAAENEAQLASVLGHEVGHIASRHSIEQMREATLAQGLAGAAGLDRNIAVNIGVDLALRRPASRRDEYEADERGFNTLGRAGYAQSAMVEFMKKLVGQSSPPTFLSTHPAAGDRVEALQERLAEIPNPGGDGLDQAAYRDRIRKLL